MAAAALTRDAPPGKPNRGVPASEAEWAISGSFILKEMEALVPDGIIKWCSFVAGCMAGVIVVRTPETDTLGLRLVLDIPSIDPSDPNRGMKLDYDVEVSPSVRMRAGAFVFTMQRQASHPDVFGKPWAEVVREGSPLFPGGKLEIKGTLKLLSKE